MQNSDSGRNAPAPVSSEVALGRCLVEGDPAVTSLARRARRRAFGASLAAETSLLALILIVPLLTGVARPPFQNILPPQLTFVRNWGERSPVRQAAPSPTVHPPSIFNPIAPHPTPGITVRPIIGDGVVPDILVPDVGGGGGGITIGGPSLPVEPPPIAPPPQPEKRPLKLSEGVVAAQLIARIEPRYPALALQIHVQGTVHLHAIISSDGRITSLEVVSGHPLLVQAALDAVRQWRYRPTLLNGEPVEVETTISVEFRLQN
jgi:protein TonB